MNTIVTKDGDGIRVHFTRYPALSAVPDPKRYDSGGYDNRLSFVMYATRATDSSGTKHEDILLDYPIHNPNPTAKRRLGIISTAQAAPMWFDAQYGVNYEQTTPPPKGQR
jgi:hypothetical protein